MVATNEPAERNSPAILERPASVTTEEPSRDATILRLRRHLERQAVESTEGDANPASATAVSGHTALPAFHAPGRQTVMSSAAFSKSEMMIVAAARELAGQHVCFVGVGLPNIAVNLAKRTVTPDLELVYEAGVFGARPARLPLSIGDPTIVTGATSVVSMYELFSFYLQGGLIDVGFLGAAQIDRFGNINTTVIGSYDAPTTRLPGSGGACEIAINAREVFVIMRQSKRSFVETIDFRTSAGNLGGAADSERIRREQGWLGRGPSVVVTDLGIWHFDDDGEMRLDSLHPDVTVDEIRAATGWQPKLAPALGETPPPTAQELRLIREELDPGGAYTR